MNANDIDDFFRLYDQIKEYVRKSDKNLYERWKAGGFIVDTDILSMYPNLSEVLYDIKPQEEEIVLE